MVCGFSALDNFSRERYSHRMANKYDLFGASVLKNGFNKCSYVNEYFFRMVILMASGRIHLTPSNCIKFGLLPTILGKISSQWSEPGLPGQISISWTSSKTNITTTMNEHNRNHINLQIIITFSSETSAFNVRTSKIELSVVFIIHKEYYLSWENWWSLV